MRFFSVIKTKSMTTAMQRLIEVIAKHKEDADPRFQAGIELIEFEINVELLLKKEKEQIVKANNDGWEDGRREKFDSEKFFRDAEDYYSKTYQSCDGGCCDNGTGYCMFCERKL